MTSCAEIVAIAAQLPNCPYTQMECEGDCGGALMVLDDMCEDEFFTYIGCVTDQPLQDFSCNPSGGITYDGAGCQTEETAFDMCVM